VVASLQDAFPVFSIATQQGYRGRRIVAVRLDGAAGLHTVVSDDPDEVRQELSRAVTPSSAGPSVPLGGGCSEPA
jgi:hypothetical protein